MASGCNDDDVALIKPPEHFNVQTTWTSLERNVHNRTPGQLEQNARICAINEELTDIGAACRKLRLMQEIELDLETGKDQIILLITKA